MYYSEALKTIQSFNPQNIDEHINILLKLEYLGFNTYEVFIVDKTIFIKSHFNQHYITITVENTKNYYSIRHSYLSSIVNKKFINIFDVEEFLDSIIIEDYDDYEHDDDDDDDED